jgi:subfamily B ATP-binding cassette protein MsbA
LDAVIALSLKPYMDVVMIDKNLQTAWYIPLLIIGFTVVQGVLRYIAEYLNTWVGAKTTNLLKMDLYKKMLMFETEFFNKKNSGDVIFMFNSNADMACAGLLNNLKSFIQKFFTAVSLVAVLFYNSWQLALVCVAIMFLAMLPMTQVRKKINSIMDQSIAADSALLTAYNETYNGNKTIISYNLNKKQRGKFGGVLDSVFRLKMKMLQRTRWLTPVMHVILSIGIGLAIWFGSYLILNGTITAGSFV